MPSRFWRLGRRKESGMSSQFLNQDSTFVRVQPDAASTTPQQPDGNGSLTTPQPGGCDDASRSAEPSAQEDVSAGQCLASHSSHPANAVVTAATSITPSATPAESESQSSDADQDPEDDLSQDARAQQTLEEQDAVGPLSENDPIWEDCPLPRTRGHRRSKGKRLSLPEDAKRQAFNPQQRLLLLDTWRRSGLPAKDFSALVNISKHTLYKWNQLFEQQGPAGLMDEVRGARSGSRLPDLTKRTILMLKQQHPEWGCQRISDMLLRGPALPASASAVAHVLREAGYESVEEPTRPHPDKVRRFERAKPNQLWQTDLFTFVLKRQNRRVHLVAFLDDHSRYIVSYGLHASASTALVLEVLEAGIASYGPPEEILTDNGPQYVTWRGKSQFTKRLEQRGIRQIVAHPKRPQTLGKIERFWGTLWREFLAAAVFVDLADARARIGQFIDYYNFQRAHQGLDGLVPADRFFGAAMDVLRTLKARVAANALELARHGKRPRPFYVTGQVAGQTFSVHAEGERLVLTREGQPREEIELTSGGSVGEGSPEGSGGISGEMARGPICPDGSLPPTAGEPACQPPPEPGQTHLELERLSKEAQDGGEPCSGPASSQESKPTEGGQS